MGTIKRNFYNNITPTGKFDSADLTGTIPADNIANASLTNVTSVPASVGDLVQKVASDPTPVGAGDVWYNTTSNALKSVVSTTATSSSAPLGTARYNAGAGGTTSAAWIAGGYPLTANTEEYNGSGWSAGGSLNTSRGGLIGTGLQTAGLAMGGGPGAAPYTSAAVEEYDGSTWTTVTSMSVERLYAGASGTQTAGAVFSGSTTPNATVRTSTTEEYDGSSWTSGGTVNDVQGHLGGCGTQTASLKAGGDTPGGSSNTSEEYNGTSWSVGNTLNTARRADGLSGLQTNAVLMGGYAPGASTGYTNIEEYDGTSFSNSSASLAAVTYYNTTAGNTSGNSALSAGGKVSGSTSGVTEEYNKSINVITGAAWASGGSGSTARSTGGSSGVKDAAIYFGGNNATQVYNNTEEYDGSSWTAGGNLNTARRSIGSAINASQTASLAFGGFSTVGGGGSFLSTSEEYNGSSWTAGNPLNTGRESSRGAGTQTAGLAFSGYGPSSNRTLTEEYDGTTWTEVNDMNTARRTLGSAGTQTAALAAGGLSTTATDDTEEWDGTSWTSVNNMINNVNQVGSFGLQTSALMFADSAAHPAGNTIVTSYDGTTWVTAPAMASSRTSAGGAGASSTSGAGFFGGTYVNTTEEFTGETVAANIVEITTS